MNLYGVIAVLLFSAVMAVMTSVVLLPIVQTVPHSSQAATLHHPALNDTSTAPQGQFWGQRYDD